MKYIIGYTAYEYDILGIRIPKMAHSRSEQPGELGVTTVDPDQLEKLEKNKTFIDLLKQKSIAILDTKPSWSVSSAETIQSLQDRIKELEAKGTAGKDTTPPAAGK